MSDRPEPPNDDRGVTADEHGLTDEDMAQIAAYLQKPAHERSVDDLGRSADGR